MGTVAMVAMMVLDRNGSEDVMEATAMVVVVVM